MLKSELSKRIEAELQKHEETSTAAIEVVDNSGMITLSGTVASNKASQLAAKIASNQPGAINVTNDITVEDGGMPFEEYVPPLSPRRTIS
jgi:osmotically-inducible protein OsmY